MAETSGGLAAEFQAAVTRRGGCAVQRVLATLTDPDLSDFQAALDPASGIDAAAISRVMEARGHSLKQHTVQSHRRGVCACPR